MGLVGVALDCTSQLVAHWASSNGDMPVGSPVFQRKMPESCQPPRIPSTSFPELERKARPFPTGISHTALALMLCRMSKSELPQLSRWRNELGMNEPLVWKFPNPVSVCN